MRGRAPHGARGLKFVQAAAARLCEMMSRPTRGAWIEMNTARTVERRCAVAPHTGRVD